MMSVMRLRIAVLASVALLAVGACDLEIGVEPTDQGSAGSSISDASAGPTARRTLVPPPPTPLP